jgi:NHL repeat
LPANDSCLTPNPLYVQPNQAFPEVFSRKIRGGSQSSLIGVSDGNLFLARLCASRSRSFAGNTNRLGLRVAGWCGMVAVLCLIWLAPAGVQAQTAYFSGTVSTLAGGFSEPVFPGGGPTGVAVDGSGDVLVANPGSNAIYEIVAVNGSIPASPTINTLGSGFNQPNGVAVDAKGDIFVADTYNNAVKEIVAVNGSIPASPTINTLAVANGNFNLPTGIAVDGNGNVYVANFVNDTSGGANAVEEILVEGGYTTVRILGTGFSFPEGVAVDAKGDVFVADYDNEEVKEIVAVDGSIPATNPTINVLGSGFNQPASVAVDGSGDVFVADSLNSEVKEIVAVDGSIPATNPTIDVLGSGFSQLVGVAVDGRGDVFAADTYNDAVKEIVTAGVSFGSAAVATTTPATRTLWFTFDTTVTIDVPAVLTKGAPNLDFTNAGTGTCAANHTYDAGDTCTVSVAFTPKSSGPRYGAVQLLSSAGTVVATGYVYGTGTGPQINFLPGAQSTLIPPTTSAPACVTAPAGSPPGPTGTAVDGSGNVYVANPCTNTVSEIMAVNGRISASPALITLGSGFNQPFDVAVDGSGNVFVTDFGNSLVKEIVAVNGSIPVSPQIITLAAATTFPGPAGIAVDASGNVYVTNFVYDNGGVTNAVEEIVAVGGSVSATSSVIQLGASAAGDGFNYPEGIAVDANGDVFVANYDSSQVDEIVAVNGSIPANNPTINVLGSGFNHPGGVAVDGNGNVFVADSLNNALKEIVAVNGSIPASNPTINVLGSGFLQPVGVAVGGNGNIFVADGGSFNPVSEANTGIGSALEELDYADAPTLTFATSTNDGTTDTTDGTGGALSVEIENNGNEPLTGIAPGLSVSADFAQVGGSGTPEDCMATFSLPAGTSCNISVEFAPVAPASGTVDGTVTLTDNNPNAVQTIPLVGTAIAIAPTITISPTTLPAATVGTAYSATLTASGGTAPYGYAIASGAVPAGITLSSSGVLAGTPAASGTFNFTVMATDSSAAPGPYSGTSSYSLLVNAGTSTAPPNFTFTGTGASASTIAPGAAATYSFSLSPQSGTYAGPVSFSVTGLPAGATATFTPSTVAANAGATTVMMTVQTAAAVAHNGGSFGRGIVLAVLLLPFGIKRSIRHRLNGWMLLLVTLVGTMAAVSGCGTSLQKQNPSVYTLTVTATSGTVVGSQAVTLDVQQQ